MDAATIGLFIGMMTVMLTVIIYLDRARRADMANGFVLIDKRLDLFEQEVDRRFDEVDRRFELLEQRFDRFEQEVDRRFEQVDKRFEGLTGGMVALAKDIGEVAGRSVISPPVGAYSAVD